MAERRLVEDEVRAVADERKRVASRVGLVDNGLGTQRRSDRLNRDDNLGLWLQHTAVRTDHLRLGSAGWYGTGHRPSLHAASEMLMLRRLGQRHLTLALLSSPLLGSQALLHALFLGVLSLAFGFERITALLLLEQWSLLGIQNPHTSLAFGVILGNTGNLEERLVERQVVTDRVLPSCLRIETEPFPFAGYPVAHLSERSSTSRQIDERAVNDGGKRSCRLERRRSDEELAVETKNLRRRITRTST